MGGQVAWMFPFILLLLFAGAFFGSFALKSGALLLVGAFGTIATPILYLGLMVADNKTEWFKKKDDPAGRRLLLTEQFGAARIVEATRHRRLVTMEKILSEIEHHAAVVTAKA